MKKFIDLTMPLSEQTTVFPGDPKVELKKVADYEANGFYDSHLSLGLHNGTHVDAPKHFVKGGASIDSYLPMRFACRAIVINSLGVKEIGKDLFNKHEILHGDAVLIRTDHSDKVRFRDYFETAPYLNEEAASYLASKKPSIVGIDSYSIDAAPFPCHKALLGANVLVLENLANLASVEGKKFKLFSFPLKLQGAEASPVRALAELYDG